jgi:hypothetical protein
MARLTFCFTDVLIKEVLSSFYGAVGSSNRKVDGDGNFFMLCCATQLQ